MSQAEYLQDMMGDPEPDLPVGPSEVASFYANRNVLLTGGSGFLGRLLIERILRSCPKTKTLFVLIRAKKGKNPEERLGELFNDMIFDRLRREQPRFHQKVVLIESDMVLVGLGLSAEHRELLRSTNIVIHGAAAVRFDETLRIAASINVRGTKELLLLAKEMVDLKAFVHISTAYSNCVSNVIDEKFYPPPIDSDKLLNLLDILDDSSLNLLTPVLVGKWPNTYAFTKAVAEETVRRNCQNLPLCIVRPSIVIATSKEPVAGWVNNFYGANGIFAGAAVCLLHTLHCDKDMVADIIPADYVVNNVIVATWDIARTRSLNVNSVDSSTFPESVEPPIYNIVSSCQRPITWGQFMKYSEQFAKDIPCMMALWYYCFTLNKHRFVHNIFVIVFHLIPAAIIDSFAWLTGGKPMLWAAYKKIHKLSSVIEYFTLQQWQFTNENVLQLLKRMSPVDRSVFDFDVRNLNWEDYCYNNIRGLRVYLLNDPLETVPRARARYARLRVAHYTLITAVCGIFVWLLWTCLRFIGL